MCAIKQNVKGDNNVVNTEIHNGLQPKDACDLALKLFRENFPLLQQEAIEEVKKRVDAFLEKLEQILIHGETENMDSFKDPGMQYALYEAMKSYAKYGTDDLLNVLTNLIANRVSLKGDFKLKVAIDEAIRLAQNVSGASLNYLTMTFICKHVSIKSKDGFDSIGTIKRFVNAFPFDPNDFEFLRSLGCFVLDLGTPFERLSMGFKVDVSEIEKEIPSSVNLLPHDYSLSYPAIVLAIINARLKGFDGFNFDIWIR